MLIAAVRSLAVCKKEISVGTDKKTCFVKQVFLLAFPEKDGMGNLKSSVSSGALPVG